MVDLVIDPFVSFAFMRRALLACFAVSLGAAPIGVFLMLRRMALTGDAIAHAMLPGVAAGFLVAGLSVTAMTLGGLVAGLAVALLSGFVTRITAQGEDTNLASFYLLSLAAGVVMVAANGSSVDLLHVLFGSILALGDDTLVLLGTIATLTVGALIALYRPLVLECVDPTFLRTVSRLGPVAHFSFLTLAVLNMVGGFHALGTLMAVGMMILPAAASRFWAAELKAMLALSVGFALAASIAGLLLSFHFDIPTGPAIVLCLGLVFIGSLALGRRGSLAALYMPRPHLEN
ncbi:MAG: metal ABC transporter permease [Hyphomicrobiaceae bacterium]|nr:metal ABC transporter permease [Hyphomicrobiaceae bacterium]